MPHYVNIGKELESFLSRRGYKLTRIGGWVENAFVRKSLDGQLEIRVATTVAENGVQRGKGEDAIRCQLVVPSNKIVWNAKHTKRVNTWKSTLTSKLEPLEVALNAGKCSNCRSVMIPKKKRDGSAAFWSCSAYPKCQNSSSMDKELQRKFLATVS